LRSDDVLERLPPHLADAVDQRGRHVKSKWALMAAEHRQGELEIVAIGIIEGEDREGLCGNVGFDAAQASSRSTMSIPSSRSDDGIFERPASPAGSHWERSAGSSGSTDAA
jgi:hypothetical protein